MRFDVITIFPELVEAITRSGIVGGAHDKGVFSLETWNPRDFTTDVHRSVDDRPYGGGPGMVMRPGPLHRAVEAARAASDTQARSRVIYLSPQGRRLDQRYVRELSGEPGLILLAGRYEGIDERVVDLVVDEECSIGDYVLAGGELAAMVLIEACVRHLDGALGNDESLIDESFSDGAAGLQSGLLDYDHYTRPADYEGRKVPEVLLAGDHKAISNWRRERALQRTRERRPDLLKDNVVEVDGSSTCSSTEN